ncbi:uncharacterized protein BX663DRAFT_412852, partial [Cokeromyces recurvatus]|uniref:uncharacterized protein n=1 Tax=Cokeromyces recurvatus TaxID=90255 RepID=UPI00221F883F
KNTPEKDIESLQITFYEIESWIEKTTPLLNRLTKELETASDRLNKYKKEFSPTKAIAFNVIKNTNKVLMTSTKDNSIKWILSFQPGNILRLDTNITSIEQLIQAVQKIRLLQLEEAVDTTYSNITALQVPALTLSEEDDTVLDLLYSFPSSSTNLPQDVISLDYWQYATGRRPEICLENYRHYRMNLNGLTKNISPAALNYIGQVFWDCLHPKFSSDWKSFWDKLDNSPRNQACIDSGLAMLFLHVIRHDKHICENAQEIAGFYFDRARDKLMEFFDEPPDCVTLETLLNLIMFCLICKRYTQARIYIGLCLNMIAELGIYKTNGLPTDNLILRRNMIKLLLLFYYYDCSLSDYVGESPTIDDSIFDISFYEICTLNDTLYELNKAKNINLQIDFDNGKTLVKESYFAHSVELLRWHNRVPMDIFNYEDFDYDQLEQMKLKKVRERDIVTHMDTTSIRAQASLLLKLQYEAQWIILHKAILSSIRRSKTTDYTSPSLLYQEQRSSRICSESADLIVKYSEVFTRCFGWCVSQQVIVCLYHASTVYCGHALEKNNFELKNRAKFMIHRIIRILQTCTIIYKGLPDDMTECLCEFLKK